jgi:steroid delta-isomerase-like uncharacterized protein
MTAQQMIAVVERGVTRFNANDIDGFLDMYERSVVFHGLPRQLRPGAGGLKDYYSQLRLSFPDVRITTEDVFAAEDKVAHRYTIYGNHRAEYLGTPASNKLVVTPGVMIYQFKGDKVTEVWQMADNYKFFMQIGAIAQPLLKR